MRPLLAALALLAFAQGICAPVAADDGPDAPKPRPSSDRAFPGANSYDEALASWRGADDINAWIGARFRYDRARALLLSETQREAGRRLPIADPATFFAAPEGVCVDLARFAVETLRRVDPGANPRYLMIEFDPIYLDGNALRRHWVVAFERNGALFFFADSKRPGHIAGPYASVEAFIDEYAAYRRRPVVAFRELEGHARVARAPAARRSREARP